ncbi:MAG: dihydropteroate synthase [Candidatus Poseidoniaceae archaeon]|nr:dihydropteroate synthase [Candidatus Poseidoniaceae archaeon]
MAGSAGGRDCRDALRAHSDGRPRLMGIINCTPDSFHPASRGGGVEDALNMVREGVEWVDIGGESTRPGADSVSIEEELSRVIPIIEGIRVQSDIYISIDTRNHEIARAALDAGADMVNDVSGLRDPEMLALVVEKDCPVCIMHMQGEPRDMQVKPSYENAFEEVYSSLLETARQLVAAGHEPETIVLDPGFGFGKTLQHNLELMGSLERGDEGFAILWGASRKSMIASMTDKEAIEERLPGTLAVAAQAQRLGVDILRVHDVAEHLDLCKVLAAIGKGGVND